MPSRRPVVPAPFRALAALGAAALLVAAGVAASVTGAQPAARAARRGAAAADTGGIDTAAVVATARRAQAAFERGHRRWLREYPGGGPPGRCHVVIGRLCIWDMNDEPPPPPDTPELVRRRQGLIETLDRAAAVAPADGWIAGQRVRYLAQAGRADDAVAAADACRAEGWWCDALRGFALHHRNDHRAAAAAFDAALAAMPAAQRCEWTDLSLWLEDRPEREYDRLPCGPERDRWERRFWGVARPLLMLAGNDLRSELLARRVMTRVEADGVNSYAMPWGGDLAECEVRYGWPVGWATQRTASLSLDLPSVVWYDPTPSFDFVPAARALARPAEAVARDWALRDPYARMRYAPRYAPRGFVDLPHQLARFRRGDSTLVVGAWDVERGWDAGLPDSLVAALADAPRVVDAGLVLVDSAGDVAQAVRAGSPRRGALALAVADLPRLASLELLDTVRGRAARARYALAPLPADARLSDLLLLTRGVGLVADVEALLDQASGSATVQAGGVVGLYWESYLPATPQAPLTVSVRATRLDTRWHERARSALGVGQRVTPVAVRFTDVGRPDGRPGRSLTLTWPSVPTGDYRVELTVTNGTETATTSRVVHVERR